MNQDGIIRILTNVPNVLVVGVAIVFLFIF